MRLILTYESNVTLNSDILLHAIRNNGYASIDDLNYYKITSYDDTDVEVEINNLYKKLKYSEIRSIKHNSHKNIYRTEFNYLGTNSHIYDKNSITLISIK